MSKEQWIERITRDKASLRFAPKNICNDIDVIRVAVTRDGTELRYASDTLKDNDDIIRVAIEQNGEALAYASERLKNNTDIVRTAISKSALAFHFASDRLKDNDNIVRETISRNGFMLHYASDRLKDNTDIVCLAVADHIGALIHASPRLRNGGLREYIEEQIRLRENTNRLPTQLLCVSTSPAEKPSSTLLHQPHAKANHMFNTINSFLGVADWEIIKRVATNMGITIPPHLQGGKKTRQQRRIKRKSRRHKFRS
jgi:hypothetical protein